MSVKPSAAIRRWKCVCAYDGTGFTGWQSQVGAAGVQDVIEARLQEVLKDSWQRADGFGGACARPGVSL
jgi:tRNA U38,U39,U40 pseudouridine synthase TruA